jgi:hypothetical protein
MLGHKAQQISIFSVTFTGKLLLLSSILHVRRKNAHTTLYTILNNYVI